MGDGGDCFFDFFHFFFPCVGGRRSGWGGMAIDDDDDDDDDDGVCMFYWPSNPRTPANISTWQNWYNLLFTLHTL